MEIAMGDPKLTADEVKEILSKNGINDIDELANMIAESESGNILQKDISPVAASWVIKVWKLSDKQIQDLKEDMMPDDIGGDIIKNKIDFDGK